MKKANILDLDSVTSYFNIFLSKFLNFIKKLFIKLIIQLIN
jgi:hypothetical protein